MKTTRETHDDLSRLVDIALCSHIALRAMTGCAGTDLESGEPILVCTSCGDQRPESEWPGRG